MKRLICCWKAQADWSWLLAGGVLATMLALLLADQFRSFGGPRQLHDTYAILEVYLPLALAMLVAGVPVAEHGAGAAEVHLTFRQPAWLRTAQMLLIPAGLWAAALALTGALIHLAYIALPARHLVEVAVPGALGLAGAALAGSSRARHQVGGMLAACVWWGVDLISGGSLNRWAYLFSHFMSGAGPAGGAAPVRLLLAGALGLALALWLAERRERWVA